MKFTTKKFMSLVFAAGLAAGANVNPSTANANGDDVPPFSAWIGDPHIEGAQATIDYEANGELRPNEYWVVHVKTGLVARDRRVTREDAPDALFKNDPNTNPPEVRLGGKYDDTRDYYASAPLGEGVKGRVEVLMQQGANPLSAFVVVEIMKSSTRQTRGNDAGRGSAPLYAAQTSDPKPLPGQTTWRYFKFNPPSAVRPWT
ncbi:MAG: hypothetical protein LBJ95_02255 [Oscillospiraceae bacterium]|jgi:hypothetical protein|nr:hypothetical protein [Oscillospiraceae bacterium]